METTWFKCPKNKTKRKMCSLVLFWQPHRLLSVSCTTCYSLFSSSSLSDMLDHPSPFSPPLNPLCLVCSQDKEQGWRERGAEEKERAGGERVCVHLPGSRFPSFHICSPRCGVLKQSGIWLKVIYWGDIQLFQEHNYHDFPLLNFKMHPIKLFNKWWSANAVNNGKLFI